MALRAYSQKPNQERRIAAERISKLFSEADAAFKKDPALSDRYVAIARKMAMKFKVRMGSELKRKFCKYCYTYLKPGANCRVRLSKAQVVYHCANCKRFMRFRYKK